MMRICIYTFSDKEIKLNKCTLTLTLFMEFKVKVSFQKDFLLD